MAIALSPAELTTLLEFGTYCLSSLRNTKISESTKKMSLVKRRVEFRGLRKAKTKKCGKSHLKTLTRG